MKRVRQLASETAASMSCGGHLCLMSFFFWSVIFGLLSLSSCTVRRGLTFEVNHDLKDKIIQDDAALTLHDIGQPLTCALRCAEKFPCMFFSHHKAEGVCVLYQPSVTSINLTRAPGFEFFTMAGFPAVTSDSEANLCPRNTATLQQGSWANISGDFCQVSVGPAGVWGISGAGALFYRVGTYGNLSAAELEWEQVFNFGISGQADVGSDIVFSVDSLAHGLWSRLGIAPSLPSGDQALGLFGWTPAALDRMWVSVSPAGSVWAVDGSDRLLHARESASRLTEDTEWDVMATDVRRVDAGRAGVWALDNAGRLHHRRGTDGDDGGTSAGTEWMTLGGEFSFVSSGTNLAVVVTSAGCVWARVGLSADTPAGLGWALYPGVMKQVEVYEDGPVAGLWAVDFSDNVYLSVLDKETGL